MFKKILMSLLVIGGLLQVSAMGNTPQNKESKKMMKMFQSVAPKDATIVQSGNAKMYCPSCGMTLPMFYKTNHAATHNGHTKQYCSIHCVAEDKIVNKKDLKDIKVVDVTTLKFIDTKKATYVVGSDKKGTMTMVSKYAFAKKADAQKFADANGGKVMNFEGAFKVAYAGLDKEMKMISKKQAMAAKKGKMIYNKMCKKTDATFNSTADAKSYISTNNLCGGLKGKKLQAVGLYLDRR